MAWQGLHISQPCRLSLKRGQIHLERAEQEPFTFSPEDVAWILFDTQQVELTAALLSACGAQGIAVIFSDPKHHPCAMSLPFHQHHRQADVSYTQIALSQPLKKRLWQAIVRQKIRNQADNLEQLDKAAAATLREMCRHVTSGDPDNVEARAARFYWQRLYQDFTRANTEDRRNSLMNYGYAIARAGVARALVAVGLLPSFGIHHDNKANAFNLADDLIEPFRPFVDQLAAARADAEPDPKELTLLDRQFMASILSINVKMNGETMNFLSATEATAASFVRAMSEKDAELLLPEFIN